MILQYKYTVKKAKKNLKLRVDRLQAMTGIIYMNRFSREKHYSLINCIIYFLLTFSSDRCVHSEEIGAYIVLVTKISMFKPVFHFNRIVTYRSIFFCVEVISSTLVLRKQRNTLHFATIRLKWKTSFTVLSYTDK